MKFTRAKIVGIITMAVLIAFFAVGVRPWRAFAQASPGYTKLNTTPVSGLNFTDSTVVDGNTYQYQVTAVNAAGESTPVTSNPGTIPATGTHTGTISWGASTTLNVTYNVYRTQITIPNPPAAASFTVN